MIVDDGEEGMGGKLEEEEEEEEGCVEADDEDGVGSNASTGNSLPQDRE